MNKIADMDIYAEKLQDVSKLLSSGLINDDQYWKIRDDLSDRWTNALVAMYIEVAEKMEKDDDGSNYVMVNNVPVFGGIEELFPVMLENGLIKDLLVDLRKEKVGG